MNQKLLNGTTIKFDEKKLEVYNTKINASKIYENYNYILSNHLSLLSFINDFKNSEDAKYIENENEAIMELSRKNENRYIAKEILKIDKHTGTPKSLEIQDNTQKLLVYILYSEIKINDEPEEILANNI